MCVCVYIYIYIYIYVCVCVCVCVEYVHFIYFSHYTNSQNRYLLEEHNNLYCY